MSAIRAHNATDDATIAEIKVQSTAEASLAVSIEMEKISRLVRIKPRVVMNRVLNDFSAFDRILGVIQHDTTTYHITLGT